MREEEGVVIWGSVEGPPTVRGPTETRDLLILNGKLVVIGDLLSHGNVSLGVDDYLLLRPKTDDLRIAVGLQGEREYSRTSDK